MAAGFGVPFPPSFPVQFSFLSSFHLYIFQLSKSPSKPRSLLHQPLLSFSLSPLSSPNISGVTSSHRPKVPRFLLMWHCPHSSPSTYSFRVVGSDRGQTEAMAVVTYMSMQICV